MQTASRLNCLARIWAVLLGMFHAIAAANAQGEAIMLPVPRVVIYAGETIQESALMEKSFSASDVARLNPVGRRSDLAGHVARRTLLTGQPINATAIKTANVIKQGQPAIAVFDSAGLSISATVVPLQSGGAGELLSFQNSESGAILRGVAQADGTIRVGAP